MGLLRTAMITQHASYSVDRRMVPILSASCSSRSASDSHSRFLCVQVQVVFFAHIVFIEMSWHAGTCVDSNTGVRRNPSTNIMRSIHHSRWDRSCFRVFSRCMKVTSGSRCETARCFQGNSAGCLPGTFLVVLRLLGLTATPMVHWSCIGS